MSVIKQCPHCRLLFGEDKEICPICGHELVIDKQETQQEAFPAPEPKKEEKKAPSPQPVKAEKIKADISPVAVSPEGAAKVDGKKLKIILIIAGVIIIIGVIVILNVLNEVKKSKVDDANKLAKHVYSDAQTYTADMEANGTPIERTDRWIGNNNYYNTPGSMYDYFDDDIYFVVYLENGVPVAAYACYRDSETFIGSYPKKADAECDETQILKFHMYGKTGGKNKSANDLFGKAD